MRIVVGVMLILTTISAGASDLPPWLRAVPSSDAALKQLNRAVFHCLRIEAVEAQSATVSDDPEDLALMAERLAPIAQATPIEERQGCPTIRIIISFYYSDLLLGVPDSNTMGAFVSLDDWAVLQRTNTPIRVCAWSRVYPRAPLASGLPGYLVERRNDLMRQALDDFMARWTRQNQPALPAP